MPETPVTVDSTQREMQLSSPASTVSLYIAYEIINMSSADDRWPNYPPYDAQVVIYNDSVLKVNLL
jgi:hypothetical protein